MKKQNNNEEIECNITQDFLPSDGAPCSESSFDFEALFNTGDSDKVFEVFKSFVKLLEKNRDIILPLKERFRAWACIAEMAAEGLDLLHLKSLKD